MGLPLGPTLANISVGYHESKLSACVQKPTIYFRYVDDTYVIFKQDVRKEAYDMYEKKLKQEIDFIKKILLDNGYPENMVLKYISKKIAQFSTAKPFGSEKCQVHLKALWIGSASQQLEHVIKSSVQNCYGGVPPRLIFSNQCMLPAAKKDVLPATQRSMSIYEYMCYCDGRYVRRTTQRLQERIKLHVLKAIKQRATLTQEQEPNNPNQSEPSQIKNAKQKIWLNSN